LPAESINGLVFSDDGKLLASSRRDPGFVTWDTLTLPSSRTHPPARHALAHLVARPGQTVEFLRSRLKPTQAVDLEQIAASIRDLDDKRYAVRQKASQSLEEWAELAEPAMRDALQNKPTLERRRRLELVLDKIESGQPLPTRLVPLRAIAALEAIGTAEARALLATLTKGAPPSRLTIEAQGALGRLSRRAGEDR
jgi:hypothetical protein